MQNIDRNAALQRRRNRLAGCVAAILGIGSPAAFATVLVTNCNDAGNGSLRAAVAAAANNDLVDASGLLGVCSQISLKTGDIVVSQKNLTIKGPGAAYLSVSAKYGFILSGGHQYDNRIFTHTGVGTLELEDITATKGYVTVAPASGGCISSAGSVYLLRSNVTYCEVHVDGVSTGGGVYAKGSLTMSKSQISGSSADGLTGFGFGGGAYSQSLFVYFSTISGNSATNTAGTSGYGGAAFVSGGAATIGNSTISRNYAASNIGGFESDRPGVVFEHRWATRTGEPLLIEWSSTPLVDDTGERGA